MIFECDKCGICCKHIDNIPQLKSFDMGNGRCKFLLDNNLCEIYEHRPDICNVSKMYEIEYSKYFTEEEYFELNFEGCLKIKSMYQNR